MRCSEPLVGILVHFIVWFAIVQPCDLKYTYSVIDYSESPHTCRLFQANKIMTKTNMTSLHHPTYKLYSPIKLYPLTLAKKPRVKSACHQNKSFYLTYLPFCQFTLFSVIYLEITGQRVTLVARYLVTLPSCRSLPKI